MLLLDELDTPDLRDWYAAAAIRHGWTCDVLRHQITTDFHEREWSHSDGRDSSFVGA